MNHSPGSEMEQETDVWPPAPVSPILKGEKSETKIPNDAERWGLIALLSAFFGIVGFMLAVIMLALSAESRHYSGLQREALLAGGFWALFFVEAFAFISGLLGRKSRVGKLGIIISTIILSVYVLFQIFPVMH